MKVLILYELLGNIITGGTDKVAQETSCIVLDKLLELLVKVDEREMLLITGQKFFQNIFFKFQIDHPCFIKCCTHLVQALGMKQMQNFSYVLIEKALSFLTSKKKPEISFKTRTEVCDLLRLVAI